LRTPKDELPQVTFHGDASLDDFHTVDGVMAEDLVKWDSIGFKEIDANLNPQTVSIKEIDVNNAYARLVIETNKTINLLNALRMTNTNAPATNETNIANSKPAREDARPTIAATNSPLPQISIGAIVITNTGVSFTDRSIQPGVNLTIKSVNGSIAGLSTEQLQHADVALNAMIDGVGPASITGTINPFSGTQTNNIKVSVKDMDLTPASPYSGRFAGYRIAEGKLNLDLAYELVGTKLNSKNVITLDRFTFGEKVESPDATHLPVRLGVAILKDREGKIVLDVPIDGDLSKPDFHVSKVVWRAVENILVKVATSPFSLLGALFGGGGEELGYQDFAAGGANLTAADRQKLDSLAKGLFARPALQLEISGSIDPDGDHEGLQRAALDREIRRRIWMKLPKSVQATNSVDQIALAPDERASWLKALFAEAVAGNKITPELIAANTNLAAYVAQIQPRGATSTKQGTQLMQPDGSAVKNQPAGTGYQSKLVPPPDPMEAALLTTFPVSQSDLEALAASRAKAVQDYLLQTGKVEAARLFLKEDPTAGLRSDGSRVYLQFK
jgi:flagellar motor protein MotB